MIIPVLCFTCQKVIANDWDKYQELLKDNTVEESLDAVGLKRMCCRRMFITHVDVVDRLLKYK